jgi:outer membrane lipoprotein
MKRILVILILLALSIACAPVLRQDLMKAGIRNPPLAQMTDDPERDRGRLFILGGIIVDTKLTDSGSQIEVLYVPVDSQGYLQSVPSSTWRFLALYPRERGILDPMIYKKGREVTIAGTLLGIYTGNIDGAKYVYTLFQVEQVYLWDQRQYADRYPYGPYWGYGGSIYYGSGWGWGFSPSFWWQW